MAVNVSKEDILYAFSIEDRHDRETVQRYFKEFPQYANEFLDLINQIRVIMLNSDSDDEDRPDPNLSKAFAKFLGQEEPIVNPFAQFKGLGFVNLAKVIQMPAAVLLGLRDRIAETSTIPMRYLVRLASETKTDIEIIKRYLDQPPFTPAIVRHRSTEKPVATAKISFKELVENTDLTEDEKRDLLAE